MMYWLYRASRRLRRGLLSRGMRLVYARALGSMGKRCRIFPGVYFANPGNVHLGDDVLVDFDCSFLCEVPAGFLRVGNGVQFNPNSSIDFAGGMIIGDDALVSEGAIVYTHDHGLDPRSAPVASQLSIGKGAWIGARSIILPSVNVIGDYAVVGAGAIVTKDVPAGAVVAGNPAKVVRTR